MNLNNTSKILTLIILIFFLFQSTIFAFSEKDLKSCGENEFAKKEGCENLKKDLNCKQEYIQIFNDAQLLYREIENDKEIEDKDNVLLYKLIEVYNFLDTKKIVINDEYNSNIEKVNDTLNKLEELKEKNSDEYVKNKAMVESFKEGQLLIKTDLENIKIYCINEIEKTKNNIFEFVPQKFKNSFQMMVKTTKGVIGEKEPVYSFEKGQSKLLENILNMNIVPTELNKEQSINSPEIKTQGFIRKTLNWFSGWLKKIF